MHVPTEASSPTIMSFHSVPVSHFGPRIGRVTLQRPTNTITIDTPGLTVPTSRGVVPHLSRDHHVSTGAIVWASIPFGHFLEHNPPLPTLQGGPLPLHSFLGFKPAQHLLCLTPRDPADLRELPPNGNTHIAIQTVRGVRKITHTAWRAYALACQPDFVEALSDLPLTVPPHSQKRLTKSIARSTAWLADFVKPGHPSNVLVHLVGGTVPAARAAYAESLVESLYGKEAENVAPYKTLDEPVSGYVFDAAALRLGLDAEAKRDSAGTVNHSEVMSSLFISSLTPLPAHKLRMVNSSISPHEILHLIQHVGIDLFDANWAQKAADVGVALDFTFPATSSGEKQNVGHNLYNSVYAHDFVRLATSFRSASQDEPSVPICPCAACSPVAPIKHLVHSALDVLSFPATSEDAPPTHLPPATRAYIHHLLHTHEMGAHALLVVHNITVLDAFFSGVRRVLGEGGPQAFAREVERFSTAYDEELAVIDQAKEAWVEVELARGKGRIAREREKQAILDTASLSASLSVAADVEALV